MAKVAVAWLNESDWPKWQALDRELPAYQTWLARITTAIQNVERSGSAAEKIEIVPEIFVSWCETNGMKVSRESRSTFAAGVLMRRLSAH